MEKDFFDVFPHLKVKKELEELLDMVFVTKVSMNPGFCNGDKPKFGFAPELGSRLQSRYETLAIPVIQMKLNGIMM